MVWLMIDFSKIFNEQEVLSPTLKYRQESADISDLVRQMNNDGLRVSNINTTGEITRVPVNASLDTRPDKGMGEMSGWYSYHETDGHFICVYGNWRTNQQWKFYSNSMKELSPVEVAELNRKIDENLQRSKEERHKRHNETAKLCEERLKNSKISTGHEYLNKKGLKNNYGLSEINGSLICPVYSTQNNYKELRSLQYITSKNKRFVSASEVKSNIYSVGIDWDQWRTYKTIAVTEGLATCLSVHESTGLPTICTFSANFGQAALENIRKFCDAEFLICFDHDLNGVGQQRTREIISNVSNCKSRIPNKKGDYNDIHINEGPEAVEKQIIIKHSFNLQQYSIKNFTTEPPPRRWLVKNTMELSKISLLCSIGGIGKSGLCLRLCLDVNNGNGKFLGNDIIQQGNCAYLSAEDDAEETGRRLSLIDKSRSYLTCEHDTYVITVADMGKPLTLIKEDLANGLHITDQAEDFKESLRQIDDLKLIVIDPIQSFVSGDMNNNSTAQLYSQFCSSLASEFGCVVLSIHHLNKSAISEGNTNSVLNARSSVRGATSLVDSHRSVNILYLDSEENTQRICFEQNIEYSRMAVVKAAMVKSNSEGDMSIKTLVRRGFNLDIVDEDNTTGSINDIDWK